MKEKIKILKTIHLALCSGLIIVYSIIGNVNSLINFNIERINTSNIIFLFIPIIAYFASNFLFNSQLKNIDSKLKLEEKFPFYQSASIAKWAVLEGASFFILFLNKNFMLFGVLIILYLISIRPTEDRIKMKLT